MPSTSSLRLHLLGAPRFEYAGERIELTAARPIALLAYLALTRAPQPREHLLDLLWTDSTVDAGRKNLRNVLWALRKALDEETLEASGDYLALSPQVWVDAKVFEQTAGQRAPASFDELQAAVGLYRGALLDGVNPVHAPEFEFWLTMERERLAQLYLKGLEAMIETRQRVGDWSTVIALARRGLRQDPLQESLCRALMAALAMRGERIEALRQYERLRSVLDHELHVEPLPETQALRNAIGRGELRPLFSTSPLASPWLRPQDWGYQEAYADGGKTPAGTVVGRPTAMIAPCLASVLRKKGERSWQSFTAYWAPS